MDRKAMDQALPRETDWPPAKLVSILAVPGALVLLAQSVMAYTGEPLSAGLALGLCVISGLAMVTAAV